MDTISLTIGVLMFFIFMSPILYVLIKQNSKEKQQKNKMIQLAKAQDLQIDHFEFYQNILIGLDTQHKKLLVANEGEQNEYNVVDLEHVQDSRISKKIEFVKIQGKRTEKILQLSLDIINELNEKILEIIFYDEESGDTTDPQTRLHIAKQWDGLIHKSLG